MPAVNGGRRLLGWFVGGLAWLLTPALLATEWSPFPDMIADAQKTFDLGVQNRSKPLLARKHFSEATDRYLAHHQKGYRNPGIYLNLGNAAVLADRWSEALWAYHVGLKLDRNNGEMRCHRDLVRNKVLALPYGQGRNEPDQWPSWLYHPSPRELASIGSIAYAFAWLFGTIAYYRRTVVAKRVAAFSLILAVLLGVGAYYDARQAEADFETPLVIVTEPTPLHRGNGASYPTHPDIALLPRGLEARQQHRRGDWLQVRLSTGEIGWIPADKALVVEP